MKRLIKQELWRLSEFLRELYLLRTPEEFAHHLRAALPRVIEGVPTPSDKSAHSSEASTVKRDGPEVLDQPQEIPSLLGLTLHSDSSHRLPVARQKDGRAFSAHARTTLTVLHPHVRRAFDNALAVAQMQHHLTALHQALEEGHQAVLSVTAEGRILFSTPQGQRLFAEYGLQTRQGSDRLPARLRAWLRGQIGPLASADGVAPHRAPLTIAGNTGALHIRVVPNGGQYLLLLHENPPQAATDLTHPGLTMRETEILGWVVQGKTNSEIGAILGISSRTVQKHLERIYRKIGVENRHSAMALVLPNHRAPR